jgi:hypothetical protein
MKLFIKILTVISLILTSCTKENEENYSYSFSENKKLNIEMYDESYMKHGNIGEGTNLVFEYEYTAEEEDNIADDEYVEFIRFEINPALTEFKYENNKLSDTKIVFSQICYCNFGYDVNKDVEPYGIISGEKVSQTEWNISIDVTFYGDERKSIVNKFRLKN